jgi:hypothetical protein
MITPNENGLILCPNCRQFFKPKLERKTNKCIQEEYPQATPEEREQLISGLCSSKCWSEFLGLPSREEFYNG